MRIGVVAGKFPAPSETFVLGQVTGLIDLGHEVDVYANRAGRSWSQAEGARVAPYGLAARTRLRPKRDAQGLARSIRTWLAHPVTAGRTLNALRYGGEAASLRLAFSAVPWLEGRRDAPCYDGVIAHFGHNARVAAMLRDAGAWRGPLAAMCHGTDVTKATAGDYRFLFRHAELILSASEMLRARLLELGGPAERCVVQRTGVDLRRFALRTRWGRGDGRVRLVTVARLVPVKGIEHAIRGVALLADDVRARISYDIVGDGPLRAGLEALIAELGLGERVRLRGHVGHDALAELLGESDVAILPSVVTASGQREGLGLSLAEAMASGMPVIGTRAGGIPELVEDGVSGFLVEAGDAGALAERIAWLAGHPERWEAMGRAGRSRVERDFDLSAQNRRVVELLGGLKS